MEGLMWLKLKLVCKIVYQIVTRDCRLRMPRLGRLKIDKEPSECTIDQIGGRQLFYQIKLITAGINNNFYCQKNNGIT
jgi:hypothetical protein